MSVPALRNVPAALEKYFTRARTHVNDYDFNLKDVHNGYAHFGRKLQIGRDFRKAEGKQSRRDALQMQRACSRAFASPD